jgi:dCMP deaminase
MYSRKIKAHLKAAKAYAELSHAKRLRVGAVLIKDDRIISIGYNGTPSGMDNNCENIVAIKKKMPPGYIYETKPEVVHAEMNVIAFAAKNGVPTDGCTMIVTHSPCFECSKLLVQAGVKSVYYETEYRLTNSLDFLKQCDVGVYKL